MAFPLHMRSSRLQCRLLCLVPRYCSCTLFLPLCFTHTPRRSISLSDRVRSPNKLTPIIKERGTYEDWADTVILPHVEAPL